MTGTASIWGAGSTVNANQSGTIVPQSFTGTAGQTVFTLTSFTYTPNTNSLEVYINGSLQISGRDYFETSSTSFTLNQGVVAGDYIDVFGLPQLSLTAVIPGGINLGGTYTLSNYLSDAIVNVKNYPYLAKGDGTTDDTAAIQAAINAAATLSLVGGIVYLPPGSYKISSTLNTYGVGQVGQVAIVGAGQFATRLLPSDDFTVLRLVTSYVDSGNFSIEWPTTVAASIPATRIGVEFASGSWQVSYATLVNVSVKYGYRSFVLNDWTGQSFGTMFLVTLRKCTSYLCADWGFYLNSKVGSTTLVIEQCYVKAQNSVGANYGKGIYVNNFDDILIKQLALDNCLDNFAQFINYVQCVIESLCLEGCSVVTNNQRAVQFNGTRAIVNGLKQISCVFNTGGTANVLGLLNITGTLQVSGYADQASTVTGTTLYYVWLNAAQSLVSITDRSVVPSNVNDNGWYANVSYEGVRRTSVNALPNYGTWIKGDVVKNGQPAVGQPKGWVRITSGSGNVLNTDWVSEGNL